MPQGVGVGLAHPEQAGIKVERTPRGCRIRRVKRAHIGTLPPTSAISATLSSTNSMASVPILSCRAIRASRADFGSQPAATTLKCSRRNGKSLRRASSASTSAASLRERTARNSPSPLSCRIPLLQRSVCGRELHPVQPVFAQDSGIEGVVEIEDERLQARRKTAWQPPQPKFLREADLGAIADGGAAMRAMRSSRKVAPSSAGDPRARINPQARQARRKILEPLVERGIWGSAASRMGAVVRRRRSDSRASSQAARSRPSR